MPLASAPRARYRFQQAKAFDEDVVERELQAKVFNWLETVDLNGIVFHVPNDRKLDRFEAARLKSLGVRRGVADLAVMRADGRTSWLELKTHRGEQSEEQVDFEQQCARLGHEYAVARSLEQVQRVLVQWGVTWSKRAGLDSAGTLDRMGADR